MSKVEDILASTKVGDVLDAAKLNKFLKRQEEEEKKPSKLVMVLAVIGIGVRSRRQSLRMLPQTRQRTNHCRKRENFQAV